MSNNRINLSNLLLNKILMSVPDLNPDRLAQVNKQFYGGIHSGIYGRDIISTMFNNMRSDEFEHVVKLYRTHPKFKVIKSIPITSLNPWLYLSLSIADHKQEYEDKLVSAFFSVIRKLTPVQLKFFITNYRRTASCKALLQNIRRQREPSSVETICQALLCDNIRRLDKDKLQTAIDDMSKRAANDTNIMQILSGLKITLRVGTSKDSKQLPKNADYYINLRGAFLYGENYTDVDFRLMDLQSADLERAQFAINNHKKNLSRNYWSFMALAFVYYNILGDPLGIKKLPISYRLTLGLSASTLLFASTYLSKQSIGGANLNDVDLSKADLRRSFFGDSTLNNTNLEGANLDLAMFVNANVKDANLSDTITLDNIDTTLDTLITRANDKTINEKIASDIIKASHSMQKDEAIHLLEKASNHGYFTPENRKLTFLQKLANFTLLTDSGFRFFMNSYDLRGKSMLLEAIDTIKNDVDYEIKIKTPSVKLVERLSVIN